jgi:hypothetical protein
LSNNCKLKTNELAIRVRGIKNKNSHFDADKSNNCRTQMINNTRPKIQILSSSVLLKK